MWTQPSWSWWGFIDYRDEMDEMDGWMREDWPWPGQSNPSPRLSMPDHRQVPVLVSQSQSQPSPSPSQSVTAKSRSLSVSPCVFYQMCTRCQSVLGKCPLEQYRIPQLPPALQPIPRTHPEINMRHLIQSPVTQ
jgi:hypothetical protein